MLPQMKLVPHSMTPKDVRSMYESARYRLARYMRCADVYVAPYVSPDTLVFSEEDDGCALFFFPFLLLRRSAYEVKKNPRKKIRILFSPIHTNDTHVSVADFFTGDKYPLHI